METLAPLFKNGTVLLFGVPTYGENRAGHRPWAENIRAAITGIQLGLNDMGINESHKIGISLFAEWTTDDEEWTYYRDNWIANDGSDN